MFVFCVTAPKVNSSDSNVGEFFLIQMGYYWYFCHHCLYFLCLFMCSYDIYFLPFDESLSNISVFFIKLDTFNINKNEIFPFKFSLYFLSQR